jgi:predicted protein tyrosine phosphatase
MSYTPLKTLQMPTIRNIREAQSTCKNYGAVLTVGPDKFEVAGFKHPNHKIVSFADVSNADYPKAPRHSQILEAVSFGMGQENLLVHCHAGISRSTATAWGVAIGNGVHPEEAIIALRDAHPQERTWLGEVMQRPFSPNELIVQHLQDIFGFRDNELIKLARKYSVWN